MHLIFNLWKDYAEKPSNKQAAAVMKGFTKDLERTKQGTGTLASNHATLVMAMLGVTPPWTADFAVIEDNAKSVQWFNNNYPMKKPLKGVELERFVSSLSRSLQQLCPNIKVTLRMMENILCEAYRHLSAENRGRVTFNDSLFPDQLVFCRRGTNVEFVTMDGSKGDLGPAILERFPFGDDVLTMEEIVHACNVHATTSYSRRESFPVNLMKPRARFQLHVELPPLQRLKYNFIRGYLKHVKKGGTTK